MTPTVDVRSVVTLVLSFKADCTIVLCCELEIVVRAFISSRLDYCKSVFTGASRNSPEHLQVVHDAAVRTDLTLTDGVADAAGSDC